NGWSVSIGISGRLRRNAQPSRGEPAPIGGVGDLRATLADREEVHRPTHRNCAWMLSRKGGKVSKTGAGYVTWPPSGALLATSGNLTRYGYLAGESDRAASSGTERQGCRRWTCGRASADQAAGITRSGQRAYYSRQGRRPRSYSQ